MTMFALFFQYLDPEIHNEPSAEVQKSNHLPPNLIRAIKSRKFPFLINEFSIEKIPILYSNLSQSLDIVVTYFHNLLISRFISNPL